MANTIIKQASNNKERQQTYAYQMGRYKRAVSGGFYFEALMIVYSLLEDRLKAMLYYCGIFPNRNTLTVTKKTKSEIKDIMIRYENSDQFRLKTIRGKMTLLRAFLKFGNQVSESEISDNEFLLSLEELLLGVDIGGLLDTLEDMSAWLDYRNEIIHSSMNKNIESLYDDLDVQVEKGMEYARYIDSQVKLMKKSNRVRKKLKLQNN